MSEIKNLLNSCMDLARDAAQLNCDLTKAGIDTVDNLIDKIAGEQKSGNTEEAIRDRLEAGFRNWNGGYDGWLEWCNTLYEPDAYYNIPFNGSQRRCTLEEYKAMMGQLFQHFTMELGDFDNMIIKNDWAAIRYTVKVKNLDTGEEILQHTMEFVKFRDNGDERGVRVVEGWALSDSALC